MASWQQLERPSPARAARGREIPYHAPRTRVREACFATGGGAGERLFALDLERVRPSTRERRGETDHERPLGGIRRAPGG